MTFAELLSRYNIQSWTEGRYCRPGWLQFHCPFDCHGLDPEKPYAGYCIAHNYVHCWRCGPHSVGSTVVALTGLSWPQAKTLLDDLESTRPLEQERPQGRLVLPAALGDLLPAHKEYLRDRGYSVSAVEKRWRVRGLGIAGNLSWRIFIPIYLHARMVSWTTRSIGNVEPRYISAGLEQESFPHKRLLYGEDFATNAISIHEGPVDVWRVGPGAVATMGTGFSSNQVLRMVRYPRRIVCFDSDETAQKRARKLCDMLESFPGETFNVVLDAKDIDDASEAEVNRLRKMLT